MVFRDKKVGKTIVLDGESQISALNINKTRLSLFIPNLTDPQCVAHSVLFYYFLSLITHRNNTTFYSVFWACAIMSNNNVTLGQVNLIPKSVEQSTDLRLSVPVCEMQHFLCLCGVSSPSSDFGTLLWVMMHTVWQLLHVELRKRTKYCWWFSDSRWLGLWSWNNWDHAELKVKVIYQNYQSVLISWLQGANRYSCEVCF